MAKTLMLRPHVLSSATTHLLLRRALLSSRPSPSPSHICPRSTQFRSYSVSFTHHRTSELHLCSSPSELFISGAGAASAANRRFTAGATPVNDSGSIGSPLMQSMELKIKQQLEAESVTVKDAYGDGRHVSIDVISSAFEGQSAVNRQRMVYKAIWEELQSTVHAVDQMTTKTPSEAAKN
ncbi:unnamed protein product [Linum tenue]|uniref:Uncharacterized protein n=1 Tax=Linum tenue TaxID=586396 RepID=A0AAV0IDY3_9ROSI|nr:unnamed protein product [Linum tenue]